MAQRLREWIEQVEQQGHQFAPHPEDEQLRSSINDVENFKETLVWKDIRELIQNRVEVLQEALVEATDLERIRRIQEEIKAWQNFELVPELLITFIEIQKDQTDGRNS